MDIDQLEEYDSEYWDICHELSEIRDKYHCIDFNDDQIFKDLVNYKLLQTKALDIRSKYKNE